MARYEIELKPVGSATAEKDYDDNQWAASLGLAWNFLPGSKIYGRAARTFRYPKVEEYVTWGSFTNLEPEQVLNFELGGEYTFCGTGRVSLAGFLMLMDDEIAYNSATYTNENLDQTRHMGIEAALRVPLFGPRFHAVADFTYMRAEFTSGLYDGNRLPLVPDWKGGIGISGRLIDQLNG
ncbi:MAG: TonB-dependent receptor, partial [Alphaproteobacteria bacterium]|nr:TonB-dependent receptor [Alphaproteobacteria bacterium]